MASSAGFTHRTVTAQVAAAIPGPRAHVPACVTAQDLAGPWIAMRTTLSFRDRQGAHVALHLGVVARGKLVAYARRSDAFAGGPGHVSVDQILARRGTVLSVAQLRGTAQALEAEGEHSDVIADFARFARRAVTERKTVTVT